MDFDQWMVIIQMLGIPMGILIFLAWCMIKISSFFAPKFDSLFKESVTTLGTVREDISNRSERDDIQTQISKQHAEVNVSILQVLAELKDQQRAHRSPFSTVHTNKALKHEANALDEIASNSPSVAVHTTLMRDELTRGEPGD